MRQTLALFIDAYRELNARKMFWIVLFISLAVVAALAMLGNNERGITFLAYTIEAAPFSTRFMSPAGFYKLIFASVGIGYWLAWGAAILALISTSSIFPELISNGSIEMVLSKPISRLRLFLTKYATGLLFVALQVMVFAVGSFVVIALRGGSVEWGIFLAIPIVVLFFSYLYCISVLVGIVTRSGITALLVTLLMWLFFWALNTTDGLMYQLTAQAQSSADRNGRLVVSLDRSIVRLESQLAALQSGGGSGESVNDQEPLDAEPPVDSGESDVPDAAAETGSQAGPSGAGGTAGRSRGMLSAMVSRARVEGEPDRIRTQLEEQRRRRDSAAEERDRSTRSVENVGRWHRWILAIKAPLPKTAETIELLQRHTISQTDQEGLHAGLAEATAADEDARAGMVRPQRGLGWVIGTSLAFQAFILGIAGLIFIRRDF